MNPYQACAACARYVRRADLQCPFCGTLLQREGARFAGAPPTRGRGSRAPWLAFGSAAVLGCTGGTTATLSRDATSPAETGSALDAAEAATEMDAEGADALADAEAPADADANAEATGTVSSFRPGDGGFVCLNGSTRVWQYDSGGGFVAVPLDGAVTCDRATQYCYLLGGASHTPEGCQNFDASNAAITPLCDGGLARCACLSFLQCSGPYCQDDDAGGITVTCGQCYGAPPARMERLRTRGDEA